MTLEICPLCDIAGCKHIRERRADLPAPDAMAAMAALAREAGLFDEKALAKVQTCNSSPEEIAERDAPVSRQVRRAMARKAAKEVRE